MKNGAEAPIFMRMALPPFGKVANMSMSLLDRFLEIATAVVISGLGLIAVAFMALMAIQAWH